MRKHDPSDPKPPLFPFVWLAPFSSGFAAPQHCELTEPVLKPSIAQAVPYITGPLSNTLKHLGTQERLGQAEDWAREKKIWKYKVMEAK